MSDRHRAAPIATLTKQATGPLAATVFDTKAEAAAVAARMTADRAYAYQPYAEAQAYPTTRCGEYVWLVEVYSGSTGDLIGWAHVHR